MASMRYLIRRLPPENQGEQCDFTSSDVFVLEARQQFIELNKNMKLRAFNIDSGGVSASW